MKNGNKANYYALVKLFVDVHIFISVRTKRKMFYKILQLKKYISNR